MLPNLAPASVHPAASPTATQTATASATKSGFVALAPACVQLGQTMAALGLTRIQTHPIRTSSGVHGLEAVIGDGHNSVRIVDYDGDKTPTNITAVIALAAERWVAKGYAPASRS